MKKKVELGIGFVTGRSNICKIINNYYKFLLEQIQQREENIRLTFYILYDLNYQYTKRTDFYGILPEVSNNIKIKYITPEDIEDQKRKLIKNQILTQEECEMFLGHGHAKGRNTIMYNALKDHMDYLLFWDDDEYPVANIKSYNGIEWKKQYNIAVHLDYIDNSDITIGYHCGYISPIPYVELGKEITEEDFKNFIESISNDIVSWESIRQKMLNDNGVTYADSFIANQIGAYELTEKWIAGSTLCINLNRINKIPAFYNPPEARGEDTFFATKLVKSKVMKVPVYHFHDGFLKYTSIMKEKYPNTLNKIKMDNTEVAKRFYRACEGWIKYKPLLMYITDRKNYQTKMKKIHEQLEISIPKINNLFEGIDFSKLIQQIEKYDMNVKQHYSDYIKTNEIWDRLKQVCKNSKD